MDHQDINEQPEPLQADDIPSALPASEDPVIPVASEENGNDIGMSDNDNISLQLSVPDAIPDTAVSESSEEHIEVSENTEPSADSPFSLSVLDDPELDIGDLLKEDNEDPLITPKKEAAPSAAPEPTSAPRTVKRVKVPPKGRPKRKKGEGLFGIPNILVTIVWCALTALIGVTLGRMAWICASDVLAFGREDKSATITVYETDSIEDITDKLYKAELIHYPGLFKLYAKFAVDDGEIHPGIWDLNTKYDYHALVRMMSPSSSREVIKLMIPEGYTCRQIFALMEENKVCTIQDLSAYAASGELEEFWFLEDVVRGDKYCLEGFLFPDTYEFYKNDTPKNVLTKMLNNFNNRFDEELCVQVDQLNAHLTDLMKRDGRSDEYIKQHQFGIRDIVNVASMIEKETSSAQESYTIASVIYNRLFSWGSTPAYLNIDATIIYALDGKTDLTSEDMNVDSPYNTYYHTGLTPGPISNPGLASIKAALAPADTNYYFYVLDPAVGSHHFSRTQEEHDAFRASIGG